MNKELLLKYSLFNNLTEKEIEKFKKIIISKRDKVELDIEESQKRADDLKNTQNHYQ